jgi:hypothetical protein
LLVLLVTETLRKVVKSKIFLWVISFNKIKTEKSHKSSVLTTRRVMDTPKY